MQNMKNLRFSFVTTLPVLFGYLFMGAAFGLLLQQTGYNFIWAFFISLFVYAGSGQFLLVGLLAQGASALQTAIMQLSINCRHFFYGISFLQKFREMGKKKFYMIFALTDETYSLLCSVKVPKELSEQSVWFQIAVLNHTYWIVGCTLGALLGGLVPFSTQGVDFTMTALFVVILTQQLVGASPKEKISSGAKRIINALRERLPVFIGLLSAVLCLFIFGADAFILPSLVLCVIMLMLFRTQIEAVKEGAL